MSLRKILIDDGENLWDTEQGANVVCTADADHKVGTKSAKMAISAGIGAALLATQDIVAGATDYSTCKIVRFWIKSSINTDAGQLQLLLDATADCPTPEETLDIPALTAGTWHLFEIALANPASDGAIVSVGLKQTAELGALDVYIDDCNGCEVFQEKQKTLTLGWYGAGGKPVPFKVDENGVQEVYDPKVADLVAAKSVGKLQVAATTIDLQQAAASYDLFIGTTQDVILEKLVIRLPNINVADDVTITSISIQTDDTTPQVFISAVTGAKANLTAEAQLGWTGVALIKAGTKIQLTIAGGAADASTVCDVVAECRAVVAEGYLA